MRICIYGAGSIGGHIAARLARSGREVTVIARGAHLDAMRTEGLKLLIGDESFTVHPHCTEDPAAAGPQDAVIVAVKGPALPEVAKGLPALLGPETTVTFAMNGLPWWYAHGLPEAAVRRIAPALARLDPDRRFAELTGPERCIGCVVTSAAEVVAPGVVRNTSTHRNRLLLGEPDGSRSARIEALAEVLAGAGFEAPIIDDIRKEFWLKLLLNLALSPVSALTCATNRTLCTSPDLRAILSTIIEEGKALAAAWDVEITEDVEGRLDVAGQSHHKPSMLQDLERGRPMEIDLLFSVTQDLARAAGVPMPVFDIVFALLRARARSAGLYPD